MKRAFSLIELIFVIVIIGILSAVALPKFNGISNQAYESNLKTFVTTLNSSVGANLWGQSMTNHKNGDISYTGLNESNITKYIDLPQEIKKIDLSKCNNATKYKIIGYANKKVVGDNYFIACLDGSSNQSPRFLLYKQINPKSELNESNLGEENTTEVDANLAKYGSIEGVLLK